MWWMSCPWRDFEENKINEAYTERQTHQNYSEESFRVDFGLIHYTFFL